MTNNKNRVEFTDNERRANNVTMSSLETNLDDGEVLTEGIKNKCKAENEVGLIRSTSLMRRCD